MSYYFKNNYYASTVRSAGFTLIELLVSISIVFVIIAMIVFGQSTYTDNVALTNLADEISLAIDQAQAYGIGVKEFSPGSNNFDISYGLTFNITDNGSNTDYLSFADRNSNEIYDEDWSCPIGGASECLEKINISLCGLHYRHTTINGQTLLYAAKSTEWTNIGDFTEVLTGITGPAI